MVETKKAKTLIDMLALVLSFLYKMDHNILCLWYDCCGYSLNKIIL